MRAVLICACLLALVAPTCAVAATTARPRASASATNLGEDIEAAIAAMARTFRGETSSTVLKTILAEGHLTFRQRLALKRFVPALSDLYNSPEFGAKLAAGATCAVVNEEWMDKQIGGGAFGLGPQKRSAQEWQDLIYEDVIRDMGFNTSKADRDFWAASGGQIVRKFVTVAQMSRYSPGTALAYYRAC